MLIKICLFPFFYSFFLFHFNSKLENFVKFYFPFYCWQNFQMKWFASVEYWTKHEYKSRCINDHSDNSNATTESNAQNVNKDAIEHGNQEQQTIAFILNVQDKHDDEREQTAKQNRIRGSTSTTLKPTVIQPTQDYFGSLVSLNEDLQKTK